MRFHLVNAFTDRPFSGNPAGVLLLPPGTWPQDAWMQNIAAEINHPETAFALPTHSPTDWAIRWFTPTVEATLCGHATLATAHTLRTTHHLDGTVRFTSNHHGTLTTHADADGTITLDFPAAPTTQTPAPDGLDAALRTIPGPTYRTGPLGDLLVHLTDEKAVRHLTPDLDAIAALTTREGIRGIIVTALAQDPTRGYDFVSRFFAPANGIPEDPVTGSAHTALAPHWAARLDRTTLTGLQASPRTGLVHTAVRRDRVELTGRAVTILEGTLHA
ncbi:PhzF family phenazine biosynthesis protein [Streptomyces sp. NPDC101118]|uniref:PhzF family phenazine biosynthesis protein n=1 Tax=Streptomyces sp. NPDC101118 TaxID=3366109 RepID=UPI00380AC286